MARKVNQTNQQLKFLNRTNSAYLVDSDDDTYYDVSGGDNSHSRRQLPGITVQGNVGEAPRISTTLPSMLEQNFRLAALTRIANAERAAKAVTQNFNVAAFTEKAATQTFNVAALTRIANAEKAVRALLEDIEDLVRNEDEFEELEREDLLKELDENWLASEKVASELASEKVASKMQEAYTGQNGPQHLENYI